MSVPTDWIEIRRDDRELVGWVVLDGEDFVTIDLLGRKGLLTDWFHAEEYLNTLGIGYLAAPYVFQRDNGTWVRVRLLEVSTDGITMKRDDFGDLSADLATYSIHFPPGPRLVPLTDFTQDPELIEGLQPFAQS